VVLFPLDLLQTNSDNFTVCRYIFAMCGLEKQNLVFLFGASVQTTDAA
jgi:hypothetical protein